MKTQKSKGKPRIERTLVIIKPDGMCMTDKIMARLLGSDLTIVAEKIITATREQACLHLNKGPIWILKYGDRTIKRRTKLHLPIEKTKQEYGQEMLDRMIDYLTAGHIHVLIFKGYNAINLVRANMGTTEPINAKPGNIRFWSEDSFEKAELENRALHNLMHGSDSTKEFWREKRIWFPELIFTNKEKQAS